MSVSILIGLGSTSLVNHCGVVVERSRLRRILGPNTGNGTPRYLARSTAVTQVFLVRGAF